MPSWFAKKSDCNSYHDGYKCFLFFDVFFEKELHINAVKKSAEVYLEALQTSKMELFTEICNCLSDSLKKAFLIPWSNVKY